MEPKFYATDLATAGTMLGSLPNEQDTSINGLRSRMELHVDRVRGFGNHIHNIADMVGGSSPSLAQGLGAAGERPPASLAELINELGSALNRIESGLSRL